MKQKFTYASDLLCLKCGIIYQINRFSGNERKDLNISRIYCYNCKEITNHIELKDASYTLARIKYKDSKLTETEELVYSLLKGKNE